MHKFGGSSLADVKGYQRVAKIIAEHTGLTDLVVVSAAGDTTDQLIQWCQMSNSDQTATDQIKHKLYQLHTRLITKLLAPLTAQSLLNQFKQQFQQLELLLQGSLNEALYAEVVGQGEIWSAHLMAALLNQQGMPANALDARLFLRAERAAQPKIDAALSYPLLAQLLAQYPQQRVVITGFICRNGCGETVLLGRNGSDYSATQIGALANVQQVTLWSDVAGIYSADPRIVKDACLLPLLRLDEASELARLAAPVLHTRTLQPVANSTLELRLRCSYQPEQGSTRIERVLASGTGTKIITSHTKISLIKLILSEQQPALALQDHINHLLHQAQLAPITWSAQSDHLLLQWCYTEEVADSAFKLLQGLTLPGTLGLHTGLSLVALVGTGVAYHPLQSNRFRQQLIDQPLEYLWQAPEGCSLVAILRTPKPQALVQSLHRQLFRAQKRIGLVLFGRGTVGTSWLEHFAQAQKRLTAHGDFEFILAGVVDHQRCWLNHQGLDPNQVMAFFNDEAQTYDDPILLQWLKRHPFDALIILDLTSNTTLLHYYITFAQHGFHLISSNCSVGSISANHFCKIEHTFHQAGSYWFYNATVGSGLPINHILRDLRDSGDTILAISGSFCSTLSWLFQHYDGTIPFTELVKQAWQQGLTPLDPRDMLSGTVILHQLVILARTAGYLIEAAQVRVESLVPETVHVRPLELFFQANNPINQQIAQRAAAAKAAGLQLRYVVRFSTNATPRIGIEAVTADHPLATQVVHDQIFVIESHWYHEQPLVIIGPANTRDAIAGTIQSDLNRLARLL